MVLSESIRNRLFDLYSQRDAIQKDIALAQMQLNRALEDEYWESRPGVRLRPMQTVRVTRMALRNRKSWDKDVPAQVGQRGVIVIIDYFLEEVDVAIGSSVIRLKIPVVQHMRKEWLKKPYERLEQDHRADVE